MSRSAFSTLLPPEDSRPGRDSSRPRPIYGASITACTTSCFVADDALAITGGRNIGDQYFTLDPRSNFVDLDVVAAGDIVPQLSASFDQFWNSKYAIPIASVASSVEAETKSAPPIEAQTIRERQMARAGTRRKKTGADLGAGDGARGSPGQNRQRNLSRRGAHHRQRHYRADGHGETGLEHYFALFHTRQGRRRAHCQAGGKTA